MKDGQYNGLLSARARQKLLTTLGAGEPVAAGSAGIYERTVDQGPMAILRTRQLPRDIGGAQIVEGVADSQLKNIQARTGGIEPGEIIWSVRRPPKEPIPVLPARRGK